MGKITTHKITGSLLILVFFVVSSISTNAEQININSSKQNSGQQQLGNNQKLQTGKLKQIINNTGNKINSGQILIQEQKNKIQEQLNKVNSGDLRKTFSGAIQKIKQIAPEEKAKLLNKAKNIINNTGSGNIANIKNQITNKKQEIIKNIRQEINIQKNLKIEEIKKQFEAKKQEIINQVKTGKLGNEEAKKQILASRDYLLNVAKSNIINEKNKIKQEKINNVKSLIKKQFETKLADISKLSKSEQKLKYQKLYNSIDSLIKNSTKSQIEVYNIMGEVLREKINSIK